jgi:hypothetical protein
VSQMSGKVIDAMVDCQVYLVSLLIVTGDSEKRNGCRTVTAWYDCIPPLPAINIYIKADRQRNAPSVRREAFLVLRLKHHLNSMHVTRTDRNRRTCRKNEVAMSYSQCSARSTL